MAPSIGDHMVTCQAKRGRACARPGMLSHVNADSPVERAFHAVGAPLARLSRPKIACAKIQFSEAFQRRKRDLASRLKISLYEKRKS
jgi:hypothetical protein